MQEKSNKKINLISMHTGHAGLMWIYDNILTAVAYSFDRGYIPVVDLKSEFNQYFKDGREYKDNVWEYYFKQPASLSLEDIEKPGFSVIKHNLDDSKHYLRFLMDNAKKSLKNKEVKFKEKFLRKIELQDEVKKSFEKEFDKLLGEEKDFLGILCRGTDYIKLRPKEHHIQPDVSDVIQKAEEICNKYNCKKIWLATEDLEIYNQFKAELRGGVTLIENFQYKFSDTENRYLNEVEVQRKDHFYNLGMEYLFSMYMLSKSKYLIGGITGALPALWVLTDGFKNQKLTCFWNIGHYGVLKKAIYRNIFERIFSVKNEFNEDMKRKVVTIFGIKLKSAFYKNKKTIGFHRV